MSAHAQLVATIEPDRTTTRRYYHRLRRLIHDTQIEINLLASPMAYERNERQAAFYACQGARAIAHYRAEIAVPVDERERARNRRWAQLHDALRLAATANQSLQQARRMAKETV